MPIFLTTPAVGLWWRQYYLLCFSAWSFPGGRCRKLYGLSNVGLWVLDTSRVNNHNQYAESGIFPYGGMGSNVKKDRDYEDLRLFLLLAPSFLSDFRRAFRSSSTEITAKSVSTSSGSISQDSIWALCPRWTFECPPYGSVITAFFFFMHFYTTIKRR